MSHIVHDLLARGDARIVDLPSEAPVRHQVEADRNFGLPTTFYGATVGCYLGFLLIVGSAFANPVLAIPMAIIVLLIFLIVTTTFKQQPGVKLVLPVSKLSIFLSRFQSTRRAIPPAMK